ncbi:hypothetical protein AAHH79_41010, partial [Burkholderia pseudomallei]
LGLIGVYIRIRLEETPAFNRHAEEREAQDKAVPKAHFRRQLARHWRELLMSDGLVMIFNVTEYKALSNMPSYLSSTL